MNPILAVTAIAIASVFGSLAWAGGEAEESTGKRFGPFEALSFDSRIVRDVKYEADTGKLFIQLLPDYKDKELKVKLSNDYFSGYRQWEDGGYELVSPPNQGKPPYAWTDWVSTSAPYIEYWMEGEVFLHLKRVN